MANIYEPTDWYGKVGGAMPSTNATSWGGTVGQQPRFPAPSTNAPANPWSLGTLGTGSAAPTPGVTPVQPIAAPGVTPAQSPYTLDALQQWAQGKFGQQATPAQIQQIAAQVGPPGPGGYTEQQFTQAQAAADAMAAAQGWVNPATPGTTTPGTTPGTTTPGTTQPSYVDSPGAYSDFFATFAPPTYTPPTPFSYDAFKAPTREEAQNEPGYEFGHDQGRRSLEAGASARGVLRTGGTLKDILAWGNKYADTNYKNVYDRSATTYANNYGLARDAWDTNRQTGLDAYNAQYKGSQDAFNALFRGQELTFADMLERWREQVRAQTQIATQPLD